MAPLLKFLAILSLLGITVAGGYSSYEDYGRGGRGGHHRPPVRRPVRPVRPVRARLCESGWLSFERPQGRWCIKVFYARSDWNAAQAGCRVHSAVLTGFQNGNERMQTARITVAFIDGGGRRDRSGYSSSSEEYGRPHRPRPPSRPRPPRVRQCESGWLSFDRPQGRWCIKVFYARSDWNAAQAGCRVHSAVLTGFQDANERMQTARITVAFILGGGGGGGRSYSSSSSSEERGRGRPHRPHRPRPPRNDPPARGCEADWLTFNRPQGTWCIKVFYARSDWNAAQAGCRAQGAVLTGFQDANERMQTANAARAVSLQYTTGLNEVWIDGVRNAECPGRNSCPKLSTFRWTDGHTTGTDGFFWPGIEPSAHTNAVLG
uniref:C-type lectin domain-containing protein n=1 Tax=Caenorhabditis tropicalis TaxID=1561998 RepID=A0A1I7U1F9_9PELO